MRTVGVVLLIVAAAAACGSTTTRKPPPTTTTAPPGVRASAAAAAACAEFHQGDITIGTDRAIDAEIFAAQQAAATAAHLDPKYEALYRNIYDFAHNTVSGPADPNNACERIGR